MCNSFIFIAPLSGSILLLDLSAVMLVFGYWGKGRIWESAATLLRWSGTVLFLTAILMLNAGYFLELALCVLLLVAAFAAILCLTLRDLPIEP